MRRALALAVGLGLGGLGCVQDRAPPAANEIRIGALLPFSGDLAASGINLERPLLMAAEAINARGGIDGREVTILAVDSNRYFPNPEEGFEVHQETLRAFLRGDTSDPRVAEDDRIIPGAGIDALIGPLIPELSVRLAAEARRNNVVHMSANVTPESNVVGKCSFSLFPSFRVLGTALGARMQADGVQTAGVVYLADDYNNKLLAQVERAFTRAGGTIVAKSPTVSGKDSYVDDIDNALAGDPEALVLLAPPRLAARIASQTLVAERSRDRVVEGAGNPLGWYFAPLLRVSDFPNNVPPGIVADGVGVAPGVRDDAAATFAERFRARWDAEPTRDALYLFDTVNVLLLALERGAAANPRQNLTTDAAYAETCAGVVSVTQDGATVSWSDALDGDAFGRSDESLDYTGLTGAVALDGLGNPTEGLVETWDVSADGDIESIAVSTVEDILRP